MAKLITPHHRGGGDGQFHLNGTSCGIDYTFELRRNRVKVTPKEPNWNQTLTEQEKLQLFRAVLDDYRLRAIGDSGFKLAAIGITDDNDIYIATNTERLSSPYFRQCAELNMVTAVTQNQVYKQLRSGTEKPTAPHLKALYLLGGKDGGGVERPLCPCGNCTDMLSHVMEPNAPIYLFPMKMNGKKDVVNDTAESVADVAPGEIWKTNTGSLNAYREIPLKSTVAEAQRAGFRQLIRQTKLPSEKAKVLADKMLSAANDDGGKLTNVQGLIGYLLDPKHLLSMPKDLMLEAQHAVDVMLKSAENALLQRTSVPELDVAFTNNRPSLTALNSFMVEKIQGTFADRVRGMKGEQLDPETLKNLVNEKVGAIRCVVIRLEDGTFRYAVEARTKLDNASPCAEMSALANASDRLGTTGVRDVWAMEMCPEDIVHGMMHTSTKEGAERLYKRRPQVGSNELQFHFIPFNSGRFVDDRKVRDMITDVPASKLFPSLFEGTQQSSVSR